MEKSLGQQILSKISMAILAIAIVDLIFINWWIFKDQSLKTKESSSENLRIIESKNILPTPQAAPSPIASDKPSPETRTVETKTVVEKEKLTITQTAQKEIFIPMGSGSTFSNSYADLTGTDVTIDTSKYPAIDSVVLEASIWVEGGNGRAYGRLYNVDDKNPYIESLISNNSGSGAVKTSGKIPIASGQKTYRVQSKTDITNFAAHVDNARLKIVLK